MHKLLAQRPRDKEDAAGLIERRRNSLDRAYLDPLVRAVGEILEDPAVWAWYQVRMEEVGR